MLIRLLWLVLLALLARAIYRALKAPFDAARRRHMPRPDDAKPELDIDERDIIEADFTEVDDPPSRRGTSRE